MELRKVIVVLLVLGILGGVIGSAALAAPKASEKTSKTELTLLDPFTLRTVTVTNARVSTTALARRAIRIPVRPQSRSAFRPNWR
jgi:hypothetical protein